MQRLLMAMMVSLRKCSFCGKDVHLGQGVMYVKNDGTIYWFCSSRCRKSTLVYKRDARKLKWARKKA